MKKTHFITMAAAAMLFSSSAWAAPYTIANSFITGTPAIAGQVNANFTAAKTAIDDNDTRINTNAATAVTNAANITTNTASASTNTTDIAANVTNITALQNAKPGFARAVGGASVTTNIPLTGTGQAVVTLTMNAPAAGFAIVTGKVFSFLPHTLNNSDVVGIKVSATSGDVVADYDLSVYQARPLQATGNYGGMITANAVIPVVAGANTIFLNAYAQGTGHLINQAKLTAVYVPNAY